MNSKEALNKIQHYINGTELSGKELLECYETIDKDLDRLEKLKKEIEHIHTGYGIELSTEYDKRLELEKENTKLKKVLEILKPILDIYTGSGKAYIDCCFGNPIITLDLYNDNDFKLYDLLKEVLKR